MPPWSILPPPLTEFWRDKRAWITARAPGLHTLIILDPSWFFSRSTFFGPEEVDPLVEKGDHLVVFVHGLRGTPLHFNYAVTQLLKQHPELHVLKAKRLWGELTYDGIDVCGERVMSEVEEELRKLEEAGHKIKKLSIIGYSLGGLVARYLIGLLNSHGVLDRLEPVNFCTFATPHVGVRTPLAGWHNHIWNVVGARALSVSGTQLFTIDKFRDTGRPLLSVMADPNLAFLQGLRKFQRKTAYANVVNDRSAVFYTTGVSRIDPFVDVNAVDINYIKGYEPVVINPDNPVTLAAARPGPTRWSKIESFLMKLPKLIAMPFLLAAGFTLGVSIFLINGFIQAMRSQYRVKLHEQGRAGVAIDNYRLPALFQSMKDTVQGAMDDIYEDFNHMEHQEYTAQAEKAGTATPDFNGSFKFPIMHQPFTAEPDAKENSLDVGSGSDTRSENSKKNKKKQKKQNGVAGNGHATSPLREDPSLANGVKKSEDSTSAKVPRPRPQRPEGLSTPGRMLSSTSLPTVSSDFTIADENTPLRGKRPEFPILALAPHQFTIIAGLDTCGFRKYPVYIHQDPHSHAAMIMRNPKPTFSEGKVVIRHWLENEFDI